MLAISSKPGQNLFVAICEKLMKGIKNLRENKTFRIKFFTLKKIKTRSAILEISAIVDVNIAKHNFLAIVPIWFK